MAVLGALSITLEVPDLDVGVKFYTDAGLIPTIAGDVVEFRCAGQSNPCLILIGGAERKRLHHLSLRADELDRMAVAIGNHRGQLVDPPPRHAPTGIWCRDPHGMLIHLLDVPAEPAQSCDTPFEINQPGRIVRVRRAAIQRRRNYAPVRPGRLGHVLVFTPDVSTSVAFMTEALGMGLADRAQDVIAFTCARRNSDHHVVAFAESAAIGFHHASFEVADPDAVGRAGRALHDRTGRGDWGVGRHTIGSNFFHYVQDPWGSWFEYYSDMDYIDDYALWTPSNYEMEDSLANWGPAVPDDFVKNYEVPHGGSL